jgi:murein DD-endopeptidase MepM/ murein hydrolase activator NlpD
VKPTRESTGKPWARSWTRVARERRASLFVILVLTAVLVLMMLYQRFMAAEYAPIDLDRAALPPGRPIPEAGRERDAGPPASHEPAAETEAVSSRPAEPAPPVPPQLLAPVSARPSRTFSPVWSEAFGDWRYHTGFDYRLPTGTAVRAAATGEVVFAGEHPLNGTTIAVDHGGGLSTRYGGLGRLHVGRGDRVSAGQEVGTVGEPGAAEADHGPHLHFEVWLHGQPVDPALYLP